MAGRFQRLDSSQDITRSPEPSYPSVYYDEPRPMYAADNTRRTSSTTRKPVPVPSQTSTYSHVSAEEPFLGNQFNTPPAGGNQFYTPRPNDVSSPPSENENPFRDSKRPSRTSFVSKTASRLWSGVRGQHVSHVATPLWAAPWRHQPCPDLGGAKASTVREFNRVKQRNRIFFHFFLQWLIPVAFCVAIGGTFYVYSSKPKITHQEKYMFNALVLGFSLCLGFAVVNGMKEYINILRWRLLARRFRSLQEFETLLGLSSQKKALRLLWMGRTAGSIVPNGTQLLCLCYLLLMLSLQVVIALLGLTQSIETSPDQVNLFKGNVSVVDLSYLGQGDDDGSMDTYQLQSGAANSYGITGENFDTIVQPNNSTGVKGQDISYTIHTDNKTSWWYWFTDRCPDPSCSSSVLTNRWVQASAKCKMMPVVLGGFYDDNNITFTNTNGNREYLLLPRNVASRTTTWMSDMNETCGSRCTSTYAVNVGLKNSATKQVIFSPQLFQCNNTVSAVGGTEKLAHREDYELPDRQARLIAGAVGYNGIRIDRLDYQARVYDSASPWSWSHNDNQPQTETEVANLLMQFSMGVAVALDLVGTRQYIDGDSPVAAQYVEIKWFWAVLILVLVPGVQFLVLLVAVAWGNTAIVRDGSYLSTAALLRPVIERLERTGCALTSDEICEVMGNPAIAYGVREPTSHVGYGGGGMMKGSDDVKHLDIMFEEEEGKGYEMGWRIGMKMPPGRYDGVKQQ